MATGIQFDTLDMQSASIVTEEISNGYAPADILNQVEQRAFRDGAILVHRQYGSKTIDVSGHLNADTIEEMDNLIDTFNAGLNKKSKNLDIDHGGSTRRYVATPDRIIISRNEGLNIANFSVSFVVPSGYGVSPVEETLYNSSTTSQSISASINVSGSAVSEPTITITVSTVTGGTDKEMSIGNAVTGQSLQVTRTWSNGDILQLNSETKEVFVNDQATEYTGRFPVFNAGLGSLSYSDQFTTRNVTINVVHIPRFL